MENVDGELLLYNPDDKRLLYCNETASLVWHLCDGSRSTEEIAALLAAEYPEAAETIPADVEETVGTFLESGAVRLA
jgi:hypothetical protein